MCLNLVSCSSTGPCLSLPSPNPLHTFTRPPSARADPLPASGLSTLPTRQVRVWAEKDFWGLVPGRSPVDWHWAHLKVSQTFCQCVFLRGLVMKNGLFPAKGCRDSTLCLSGHWIPSRRQLAQPPPLSEAQLTSGPQRGLNLKAREWGHQQVSLGQEELPLEVQS